MKSNRISLSLIFTCLSIGAYAANAGTTGATAPASAPVAKITASATTGITGGVIVNSNISCEEASPCSVITDTSRRALDAVNKGVTQTQTMNLIQAVILPQFDFTLMTKYALGNNWKLATPEQQTQLVDLFKQLLVYTYSSALSKFKNAHITITKSNIDDRKAAVISEVVLPNAGNGTQPVLVEYDLAKTSPTNPWRAYDVKIENASLVTTYRNQFNDVVQSSKIEGLIKQLQTKVSALKGKNNS